MTDRMMYREKDLTIIMDDDGMTVQRDGQSVTFTEDEMTRCQQYFAAQLKDALNDFFGGEDYADGSRRINKPCPKCGMSYLLFKDGLLHCNDVRCDYTKPVDTTEQR